MVVSSRRAAHFRGRRLTRPSARPPDPVHWAPGHRTERANNTAPQAPADSPSSLTRGSLRHPVSSTQGSQDNTKTTSWLVSAKTHSPCSFTHLSYARVQCWEQNTDPKSVPVLQELTSRQGSRHFSPKSQGCWGRGGRCPQYLFPAPWHIHIVCILQGPAEMPSALCCSNDTATSQGCLSPLSVHSRHMFFCAQLAFTIDSAFWKGKDHLTLWIFKPRHTIPCT